MPPTSRPCIAPRWNRAIRQTGRLRRRIRSPSPHALDAGKPDHEPELGLVLKPPAAPLQCHDQGRHGAALAEAHDACGGGGVAATERTGMGRPAAGAREWAGRQSESGTGGARSAQGPPPRTVKGSLLAHGLRCQLHRGLPVQHLPLPVGQLLHVPPPETMCPRRRGLGSVGACKPSRALAPGGTPPCTRGSPSNPRTRHALVVGPLEERRHVIRNGPRRRVRGVDVCDLRGGGHPWKAAGWSTHPACHAAGHPTVH